MGLNQFTESNEAHSSEIHRLKQRLSRDGNMKRQVAVTIETHRVLLQRGPKRSLLVRCTNCARQTPMLTPDEVATFARVSTQVIYRWMESNNVHFKVTPDGLLLICLGSLRMTQTEIVSVSNRDPSHNSFDPSHFASREAINEICNLQTLFKSLPDRDLSLFSKGGNENDSHK